MVNVDRNMNAMQIEATAQMIVQEHWIYSLEDIQICLDRGCMGMYGELYNRLDGSVVFTWIKKYEEERNAVIRQRKKIEMDGNNIYEAFQHTVMLDAMHTVVDKMQHRQDRKPEPFHQPSPFEQMVMSEWDTLPLVSGQQWLKLYKEQAFDFTGYRQRRFEEEVKEIDEADNANES